MVIEILLWKNAGLISCFCSSTINKIRTENLICEKIFLSKRFLSFIFNKRCLEERVIHFFGNLAVEIDDGTNVTL